jgi:hypothetical protein
MTPVAEFTRSAGIAAMSFPEYSGLTFSFGGHPIQFGVFEEIGPNDVEVLLSDRDLHDYRFSRVIGLICFLADVRGVNIILNLASVDEAQLPHVREMFALNGFNSCREADDGNMDLWIRLARSIAA